MTGVGPLTDLMIENEINALTRVHGMLQVDGVNSREQFRDMMSAAFGRGGLEVRALADDLGFSFSTVFRWKENGSAPHASVWPRIVAWVLEALVVRIDGLKASLKERGEETTG